MSSFIKELQEQFKQVRLLGLDVDGVLTDGGVYVLENGQEFRRFNIKDGMGLKRVMAMGIAVVWISAGTNLSIQHRANQLGVKEVHLGAVDKLNDLSGICNRQGIDLQQVAYIGDDYADLEVLQQVGLACAPADAVDDIKRAANYVSNACGGYGAVREICDLILSIQKNQ